jgi:uroporphyrinogen III methyltransferase / synthase
VVVTRPHVRAAELVARLDDLGLDVEVCPLIATQATGPREVRVDGHDWIVVTSRTSVEELVARARGLWPAVAAVGPGTADALREHGIAPAVVASVSTQEGLLAALPSAPGRVLFAGAEGARRLLADELAADFVPLYRTFELRPERFPEADLAILASASAARAYAAIGAPAPAVSIGPETSAAARGAGVRVVAEAETHDVDGLVAAVGRAAGTLPHR